MRHCLAVVVLGCMGVHSPSLGDNQGIQPELDVAYLDRLASFSTNLRRVGAAPHSARKLKPTSGFREVTYPSGKLRLKAWVYAPQTGERRKPPGVVHLHGGFGISNGHFHTVKPFQRAGFVVMLPALRGENENPGTFEMFLAEVEDAKAAVRWLQRSGLVDPSQLYVFGHSGGGVISALLSLHNDVPIRHSGSCGSLYDTSLFDQIKNKVPFDLDREQECQLRVLPGNIRWMKRRHFAFIGKEDIGVHAGTRSASDELNRLKRQGQQTRLTIIPQPGTHNSSLPHSIEKYIAIIRDNQR